MVNFLEFIQNTKKIFELNGIENINLESKLILSLYFNIKLKDMFMYHNNIISEKDEEKLNKIIKLRLQNKPLSKIFHKKTFWDFEFYVDENVLDPRFDTEIMIEEIIKTYNTTDELTILDLGTGSGCIIITLLKMFKNMTGTAVDISKEALNVACKNAEKLGVNKRCEFKHSRWNDEVDDKFDIIVSNPPYIPNEVIKTLSPMVQNFDPFLALSGGEDGLDCYRFLAENLEKNYKDTTKIFLEIGCDQKDDVVKIFEDNGYKFIKSVNDYSGICRVLVFGK